MEKRQDYVISETYIKFDLNYTKENIEVVKNLIKSILLEREKLETRHEIYEITIDFENGSLKTRIRYWGVLAFGLYIGIGNYASFRDGIREIINDYKGVSTYIFNQLTNNNIIDSENIIRTEKRKGINGRISDIYSSIDELQRNLDNLSPNEINEHLNIIKQQISDMGQVLNANDRMIFIQGLPIQYTNNLPVPIPNKVNYLINRYAIRKDEELVLLEQGH